jgi:acetate kinase
MRRILVLNAGSGSQTCSLFELPDTRLPAEPLEPIWESKYNSTTPGQPPGKIVLRVRRGNVEIDAGSVATESDALERNERLLELLWDSRTKIVTRPSEIDLIGHRVVHGGAVFAAAVRVTEDVEATIHRCSVFAPLHNPNSLIGIRVARKIFGAETPQTAVFDTAFHRTLSESAATYAGPYHWLEQGIRRYGFHGTSFRWAAERSAHMLNSKQDNELRLILCHLGGGCSLCATRGGRSIDTTMGFTPLDGVAMCTRSGTVDPGILIYLAGQGATIDELNRVLNQESGLKGLSGLPGDTRIIIPEANKGNPRAILAMNVFIHRLRAGIGEMLAALGQPPHAIVFTDVIGESEPGIRAAACEAFGFLGLHLDQSRNAVSPADTDIAAPESAVRVLLIKSREAWQIARESFALLNGQH